MKICNNRKPAGKVLFMGLAETMEAASHLGVKVLRGCGSQCHSHATSLNGTRPGDVRLPVGPYQYRWLQSDLWTSVNTFDLKGRISNKDGKKGVLTSQPTFGNNSQCILENNTTRYVIP